MMPPLPPLPVGLIAETTKMVFALAIKGTLLSSPGSFGIISLAQGVLRSMVVAKLWHTSAVVVLSTLIVGTGAGVVAVRSGATFGAFARGAQVGDELPTAKQTQNKAGAGGQTEVRSTKPDAGRADSTLLEAAKKEYEARMKEYLAGRGTFDFVLEASNVLRDAELQGATKHVDRTTALTDQLVRVYELWKINKLRFEGGKITSRDLARAQRAYEEAVAQLVQEQNSEKNPAPELIRSVIDFKMVDEADKLLFKYREVLKSEREQKLIEELLAAAADEWEARWSEFTAGRGTQAFVIASSKRLRDAELKGTTKSGRSCRRIPVSFQPHERTRENRPTSLRRRQDCHARPEGSQLCKNRGRAGTRTSEDSWCPGGPVGKCQSR